MNYPRRHPREGSISPKAFPLLAGVLLFAVSITQAAGSPFQLKLVSGSSLYLKGSSTLHPYASTSTLTQVSVELAPDTVSQATVPVQELLEGIARKGQFQHFEVIVPVKGLKSGESGLDKNMYKALKADQAPEIHFALTSYKAGDPTGDGNLGFQASGSLSIAGVTKDIVLQGTAQTNASELAVEGQYPLLMSDYGVKPPTLMFGAIKVADPVTIHFHLLFQVVKGVSQ